MKITISEPDGPYSCTLETGVMEVRIQNVFMGLALVSPDGEVLRVAMRDSGFEVGYSADFGDHGFNCGTTEFKNGVITKEGEKPPEATESNLVRHARRELERVETDPWMIDGLCKVVQAFAEMGHGGGSAGFGIQALHDLLQFNNLSPLTNDPLEWNRVDEDVWQSNRNSEAFSTDGGQTYYLVSDPETVHKSEDMKDINEYIEEKVAEES